MNQDVKQQVQRRLRRVAGQVDGVSRMVDDDRYCVDVLHQISAAQAALARVSKLLLESHIDTCVREAFESDDPDARDAKMAELAEVFDKHCRC